MGREPVDTHLGRWLRTQREKRGWSIAYVVRRLHRQISTQYLSMIELGQRGPSLAMITKLCEFYGITSDELMQQLEVQQTQLNEAEKDRYALFRAICELEDDQRYQMHKALVPLLEAVKRRKAARHNRYLRKQEQQENDVAAI